MGVRPMAQKYPIKLLANHPVQTWGETRRFVRSARDSGIDCKLIDLLNNMTDSLSGDQMPWHEEGYTRTTDGNTWQHSDTHHRIHTRQCGGEHNTSNDTLFIGTDGIRRVLDGPVIGHAEDFDIQFLSDSHSSLTTFQKIADTLVRPTRGTHAKS